MQAGEDDPGMIIVASHGHSDTTPATACAPPAFRRGPGPGVAGEHRRGAAGHRPRGPGAHVGRAVPTAVDHLPDANADAEAAAASHRDALATPRDAPAQL